MFLHHFLLLIISLNCLESALSLKTIASDDDLMNLIRTEKSLIILFTTANQCVECEKLEKALIESSDELSVTPLDAIIVKTIDSQLKRLYSPQAEPALVFFRHGVPLLFHGPSNSELITHIFTVNREPVVKELTDDSFEHLTQASSGATTGDWFIMFYTNECVDCARLQARWEAVGAQVKSRINVARVNKSLKGAITAKRFKITQVPAFLLFKQGKLYRYNIQKHDVPSFVSFAYDWHKNVAPEKVPAPQTPFDALVESSLDFILSVPWIWQIFTASALIVVFIVVLLKCALFSNGKTKKTAQKKEK